MERAKKDTHAHCPVCQEVMPPDAISKHLKVTHDRIVCECGEAFEPSKIKAHRDNVRCTQHVVLFCFCYSYTIDQEASRLLCTAGETWQSDLNFCDFALHYAFNTHRDKELMPPPLFERRVVRDRVLL